MPASLRPFQATLALAPAPVIVRTTAPAAPPTTGAAVSRQEVAPPLEAIFAVRESRRPSPSGESRVELIDDELTVGAIRSIVTAYIATWAGVTGRADGAV